MLIELIKKIIIVVLCLTGLIGCVGEQRPLANGSTQPAQEATRTNPDSVQEAGNDQNPQPAGPAATPGAAGSTAETPPGAQTSQNAPSAGGDVGQDEAATQQSSSSISFQEDIRPLFEKRCMMCHKYTLHRIQWTEYDESMQYVNSGQLLERVWNLQDMPPPGMEMTEEERKLVKDWIEGGAPP